MSAYNHALKICLLKLMEVVFHNVKLEYLIEICNAIHQQTHANIIDKKEIIQFVLHSVNQMS